MVKAACLLGFVVAVIAIPLILRPSDHSARSDSLGSDAHPLSRPEISMRARSLLDRLDREPISTAVGPNALLHALAARRADFPVVESSGSATGRCVSWLFDDAAWRPVHGQPLMEMGPAGWQFRRSAPGMSDGFEAHFGQFTCLLLESGVAIGLDPKIAVDEAGSSTSLESIITSLCGNYHRGIDPSWFLVALLRTDRQEQWSNRFGERFSIDDVVSTLLAVNPDEAPCAGCHWRKALCLTATLGRDRIGTRTYLRVMDRLSGCLDAELAGLDAASGLFRAHAAEPLASITPDAVDAMVSYQAHTIEWLLLAPAEMSVFGDARLHRGVGELIDMVESHGADLIPETKSHAAMALRLYCDR